LRNTSSNSPQPGAAVEFWHDVLIEKSWAVLLELRKRYEFILLGGWAVYLYTKALKSKDIDIIVDYNTLGLMGRELPLKKNERLRKYELLISDVEVEVYVPYFSNLGIPVEDVAANIRVLEGFKVPTPEVLLILKQAAEVERAGSVKGLKDRIDILALLIYSEIDFNTYLSLVKKYSLYSYRERLKNLVETADREFKELGITNPRQIRLLRKKISSVM
jgi:hypothetical protein